MKSLEKLTYELRPYIYALIALFALYNYQVSKVMLFSGLMLAICSYAVFTLRHEYRKIVVPQKFKRKQ